MDNLPVDDLKDLGVKLQQSIVLTRMRLVSDGSRKSVKAKRVLDNAEKLFVHLSQVVHATTGLTGFMERAMGVTINDLFALSGHEKVARGAAYAGILAVNQAVRKTIDELAAVNVALDKEVKHAQH